MLFSEIFPYASNSFNNFNNTNEYDYENLPSIMFGDDTKEYLKFTF